METARPGDRSRLDIPGTERLRVANEPRSGAVREWLGRSYGSGSVACGDRVLIDVGRQVPGPPSLPRAGREPGVFVEVVGRVRHGAA